MTKSLKEVALEKVEEYMREIEHNWDKDTPDVAITATVGNLRNFVVNYLFKD